MYYFRSLKTLQTKLRNQQQVNAQMEEQRKKDEVILFLYHNTNIIFYEC